ncbi:hypothetical protein [Lederbergia lenta]|uniref:hypothetical protein n=1 Tax=Lederbergia lenta TaxID=1467 RepID=UPI00203C4AF9|nr:hypothetical protein [Lederbergia lenta]MCM3109862.1 hypothetical protein [Lederbergia lenta]
MIRLYEYQQELLSNEDDVVVLNWCRSSGLDTAIVLYILERKPKKVGIEFGCGVNLRSLNEALGVLSKNYDISFEFDLTHRITILFESTGEEIRIESATRGVGASYDLIVTSPSNRHIPKDTRYLKRIITTCRNEHSYTKKKSIKYITVDYKRALNEGAITLDFIANYLLSFERKYFYSQLALMNEPKIESLSFNEFSEEAVQRLQKQFLDTPDTKDTVLTRKNIIEMMKDIKEMSSNKLNYNNALHK